ncbi:MAG: hypothetical protein BJ554DRAFT_527, partial [Olpidium bornovanus]
DAAQSDVATEGDSPKTPASRKSANLINGQQTPAHGPAAQPPAPSTPGGKKGTPPEKAGGTQRAVLGGKIQLAMMDSGSPDDTLLIGLVAENIKEAVSQNKSGWVLVGHWRHLAGDYASRWVYKRLRFRYEDPKPVKPGNLKRQGTAGKEKPSTPVKKKSMIAPTRYDPDEANAAPPTSGIDKLIYLDIDNETAFRRAAGRRVDPLTGNTYHLDLRPPPRDVPVRAAVLRGAAKQLPAKAPPPEKPGGVHGRLVPPDDDGNKDTQLQFQLAAFEDLIGPITDWYSRFQNLVVSPELRGRCAKARRSCVVVDQ